MFFHVFITFSFFDCKIYEYAEKMILTSKQHVRWSKYTAKVYTLPHSHHQLLTVYILVILNLPNKKKCESDLYFVRHDFVYI